MFKYIFLIIISLPLLAMEKEINQEQEDGPYLCGYLAEDGKMISVNHHHNTSGTEFNYFFYSFEETESLYDEKNLIICDKPLLMQLCVQASKAKNLDPNPFEYLLSKIKDSINQQVPVIGLTPKDCMHRLLSYIPANNHRRCGQIQLQLVNDKIIDLSLTSTMQLVQEISSDRLSNSKDLPQTKYERHDIQKLESSYNFLQDPAHHEKIVEEFNKLIGNDVSNSKSFLGIEF